MEQGWPLVSSRTCVAQGALLQYGDLSSAAGSMLLAIHLFCKPRLRISAGGEQIPTDVHWGVRENVGIIVFSWKPPHWLVLCALASAMLFSFFLTIAGPLFIEIPGSPFCTPRL